jgi:LacI family transcriptional regulator
LNKAKVKRVTLADIAKEAGVSVPSVAKVITGCRCNICVSDAKAALIREIAERLHYRPNLHAKALAGGSIKMLGVLVDSCAPLQTVRILSNIESAAADRGYRVIVGQSHNSISGLFDCYEYFQQSAVDGVIVLAHEYPDKRREIHDYFKKCQRTVLVGQNYVPELPSVIIERGEAVKNALQAILKSGKKRLGMYHVRNGEKYFGFQDMTRAVEANVADFRYFPIGEAVTNEEMEKLTDEVIEKFILKEKLDAVFCPNDLYAALLLKKLSLRGITVPDDIAVIGWDNDVYAPFLQPALTSVDEEVAATGQKAVELLLHIINSAATAMTPHIRVKAKFISRASV